MEVVGVFPPRYPHDTMYHSSEVICICISTNERDFEDDPPPCNRSWSK